VSERITQIELRIVGWLAAIVSIVSFLAFYQRDQIMLSGDAVAHIGIARRVFDSLTPGPLQLGTVWLPLQHLLILPFIVSDRLWRTGVGGSVPSLAGYVLAVAGVFRLARVGLEESDLRDQAAAAAWFAALLFALNPNLLYVQATALNESLYLAESAWAIGFFLDFTKWVRLEAWDAAAQALRRCAVVLAAAILTRYDGWFLATICGSGLVLMIWRETPLRASLRDAAPTRRAVTAFILLLALTPALWLAYNYGVFHDPLEFARGPYSARAILQRTTRPGDAFYPGYHSLGVAAMYFLKCARLNVAEGRWEPWLLLLASAGTVIMVARRRWTWLLLWAPLPFYAISIAYGGVPIFIPTWWPFSFYNARYGLQLLPAIAVFSAISMAWVMRITQRGRWGAVVPLTFVALVAGSYGSVWRAQPICLREAVANSRTRIPYEKTLADQLEVLPPGATLLMFIGDHSDALRRAGIPLQRVLNESNYPVWQLALEDPAGHADYVVAMDGGPVAAAVQKHRDGLESMVVITSLGQPRTTLYKSLAPTRR